MNTYSVLYVIQVDGETPLDAALKVEQYMRRPTFRPHLVVGREHLAGDMPQILELYDTESIDLQDHGWQENRPKRVAEMDYVLHVTVIDPDTQNPVDVTIYKCRNSGAMIGLDSSYMEQDVDLVRDPYNDDTELIEAE